MDKKLKEIPVFGDRLEVYRKIDSTQKRAKEILKENPVKALIISEQQTTGLGRRGNIWESPAGGFYFSIITKPSGKIELSSMFILIAILKTFKKFNYGLSWKWPNDLIYKEGKVGGILTEVFNGGWVLFGVGINTGFDIRTLKDKVGDSVSIIELDQSLFMNEFLPILDKSLKGSVIDPEDHSFLMERLTLIEETVKIGEVEGKVKGIDSEGVLEVITETGITKIVSGTVTEVKYDVYGHINRLAIDIGNTSTKVGFIVSLNNIHSTVLSTYPNNDLPERLIKSITEILPGDPSKILISSVVPEIDDAVMDSLKKKFNVEIIKITPEMKLDIELKVRDIVQVGADRIANAVAAYKLFGQDVIIIDLGTANTFDVVTKTGEYLGGIIAPGIDSMTDALLSRASKLSNYTYRIPSKAVGDDTATCLDAGVFYTLKGQILSSIDAISNELKKDFKVIITGGGIEKLDKGFVENFIVDKDLTLKGLALIANK